jgi:tRNA A-37 threonylcarbamoyl transferase component Bud32/tetratricopeptide (TPR) repeat protein
VPVSTEHYLPVLGADGLEQELGRGGIGRVLLVSDAHLGRDVAMKLLLNKRLEDPEVLHGIEQRFVREARVTGQLEHPAIVPVYEMGRRPDGSLYYVMRRIRGHTLASAVASAAKLEERLKLLPRVLAVCQAIAFAHSRQVVHRDLKPQNVMLDRYGETYVVDWGLASVRGQTDAVLGSPGPLTDELGALRLTPELTIGVSHLVIGTPAYMSPEQAEGDVTKVDELSDVWGLGAILYEVITGKIPRSSLQAPIRPVLEVEPAAPPELAAICTKALAVDRSQRYSSAEALALDLDAWVHDRRVQAYEYGPLELLKRFTRTYRAPIAVGLVAALALLILGLSSVHRVRMERDEARELAQLVFGDLGKQLTPVPGTAPVVEAVTRRAITFYERVLNEQTVSLEERQAMANAVLRLAELNAKLGRADEALRLATLCNQLVSPVEGATRERPSSLINAVGCEVSLATLAFKQGNMAEAEKHLDEADRRLALGPSTWNEPDWLRTQSTVVSRRFQLAWEGGDTARAKAMAEREVAIDEKVYAAIPKSSDAAEALAGSLGDLSLTALGSGDNEAAIAAGARAIELLRAVQGLATNANALGRLAGCLSQQANTLVLSGHDGPEVVALRREAADRWERLLTLEPGMVASRQDYAVHLLRMGEGPKAYEQFIRANGQDELEFALAALLAGHPDEVISRRAAIEAKAEHRGLWVLAVALAVTGDAKSGAAVARLGTEIDPIVEWPSAAVHAWAAKVGGPLGVTLEQFATEYDATLADGGTTKTWPTLMEHLAQSLDALAK